MRRNLLIVVAVLLVVSISVGVSRLEPAAPQANRETLFFGTVQRGSMLREVRGPGTLVPVDVRWITVAVEGNIESIPALPGATVTPDTVLLELSNPVIEQDAFEAESQLRAGEADLENLRARLDSELLGQQAQVAAAESQDEQAKLQVEADQRLFQEELIPELDLKLSRLRSTQLSKQSNIERQRYVQAQRSNQAQLAAQYARVAQLRALYDLRQRQVESLKVRAGIAGVLQDLPVQVGQRVPPGTQLARVARPEELKAELRIPETQAKDVTVGLKASIDTRNGDISGRVIRVAPSAQDGTVIVDVQLEGALPRGARPNLTVDGTIEIEKLDNVLFVGRPTFGQANSKVEMFKVVDDGNAAVRVPVQLGRTSVSTVEIVNGLEVGDEVVLSDTSQYDGFDRIRLNG